MAIRLVRHDTSLVNPCCLFPITIFSFTCPEICFKRTHSMVLPMGSSESARPVVPQVDLLAFFWTQVQHLPCHWVPNPLKFYFFVTFSGFCKNPFISSFIAWGEREGLNTTDTTVPLKEWLKSLLIFLDQCMVNGLVCERAPMAYPKHWSQGNPIKGKRKS